MNDREKALKLANETGAGIRLCYQAILYANEHPDVTALGYVRAKGLAVATPGLTFHERVIRFSEVTE